MPEKKTMTQFQKLLRVAIGPVRTQTAFAQEIGMSVAQINRLLNKSDTSRPSVSTLRRIADASESRVTAEQLAQALDAPAPAEEADTDRQPLDFLLTSRKQRDDLIEGIHRFCGLATAQSSIPDVLEIVAMLYSDTDVTFEYQKKNPNGKYSMSTEFSAMDIKPVGHRNAEQTANVIAKWEDEYAEYFVAFTLFFCETTGGAVILSDVAFDLQTLMDYNHIEGLRLVMHLSEKQDINISDYNIVDGLKAKNAAKIQEENEAVRRLLRAIFGENEKSEEEFDALLDRIHKRNRKKKMEAGKDQESP